MQNCRSIGMRPLPLLLIHIVSLNEACEKYVIMYSNFLKISQREKLQYVAYLVYCKGHRQQQQRNAHKGELCPCMAKATQVPHHGKNCYFKVALTKTRSFLSYQKSYAQQVCYLGQLVWKCRLIKEQLKLGIEY